MSPLLHPFLFTIWTLTIVAYFLLMFRASHFLWFFALLNVVQYWATWAAFLSSPKAVPYWYYYGFWDLQYAMDALVLWFAVRYGVRNFRLGKVKRDNSRLVTVGISACVLALMLWRDQPAGTMLLVNHAVRVAVTGVVLLMLLCSGGEDGRRIEESYRGSQGYANKVSSRLRILWSTNEAYRSSEEEGRVRPCVGMSESETPMMQGFAAFYAVGLVTSGLWAWHPVNHDALWFADLIVQLGVTLWWLSKQFEEAR